MVRTTDSWSIDQDLNMSWGESIMKISLDTYFWIRKRNLQFLSQCLLNLVFYKPKSIILVHVQAKDKTASIFNRDGFVNEDRSTFFNFV